MNQPETIAAQLRKPSGEHAREVAALMAEHNRKLILQTYALLAPAPGEKLLELGPGSGVYLELLLQAIGPEGRLHGLDYSPDMLTAASELNRSWIAAGRLELILGNIGSQPFANHSLDGICSINTLYFWDEPVGYLYECRRVLKSGGRLALGFRSRQAVAGMAFTQYGFTLYSPAEAALLLEQNGFEVIQLQREIDTETDAISLLAVKP